MTCEDRLDGKACADGSEDCEWFRNEFSGKVLYNIQCSEIFTLRNEHFHTET